MLRGKRPRPPMRRTTSVKEFSAADLATASEDEGRERWKLATARSSHRWTVSDLQSARTAPFLRACGLCKRRLGPGLDTFIYRGEIAFCSLECRQNHMNLDELKEKCSLTSLKTDAPQATAGSEASTNGETAAAA